MVVGGILLFDFLRDFCFLLGFETRRWRVGGWGCFVEFVDYVDVDGGMRW